MWVRKTFARRFRRCRRSFNHFARVILVLLCLIGLLSLSFLKCRPTMTAFAESQAVWEATRIANRTVAHLLQEYAQLCVNTVAVTYADDQSVASISTDTTAVNTVRTAITEAVMKELEQVACIPVDIPLGTLAGWHWLSGIGPLLTFPISFTATVLSSVSSTIEAVGINQSVYRMLIHLAIQLCVVTPGGRSTVGMDVSYPMAEVVILGEVPDNLTEVYGDDQSLLGQIFDYGTID